MKHLRILIIAAMLVFPAVTFAWDLTNPGADKLIGWDNSAPAGSQTTWFGAGTGLEFNGTDIQVKFGTTASTVSEGNHGHSGVYELVGVAAGLDHAAVTLDADAAVIFDLSTQEIGLDVQTANTVFAGPTTGEANEPTFRALVAGDIPDISTTYEPVDATILRSANIDTAGGPQLYDADLSAASSATGSGNSKYFGTSGAGVVGFHDLPDADLGFTVDPPGASGGVLQSNGTKWERVDSYGSVEIGGLTASMAVHSTASGILASHADVSSTELGYLDGLSEALTTTLAARALATHSRSEFIPVAWMIDGAVPPTALATTDLGTRQAKTRAFQADTADQDLEMFWQAPIDIIDGAAGAGFQVKWRPIFVITSATGPASGEGVAFALAACSSGNGDTGDCTVGTAAVIADADLDAHVQFDIVYGGWTEMTVTDGAASEAWMMKFYRDQDNAIDDYVQSVGVIGIELKYKVTIADSY